MQVFLGLLILVPVLIDAIAINSNAKEQGVHKPLLLNRHKLPNQLNNEHHGLQKGHQEARAHPLKANRLDTRHLTHESHGLHQARAHSLKVVPVANRKATEHGEARSHPVKATFNQIPNQRKNLNVFHKELNHVVNAAIPRSLHDQHHLKPNSRIGTVQKDNFNNLTGRANLISIGAQFVNHYFQLKESFVNIVRNLVSQIQINKGGIVNSLLEQIAQNQPNSSSTLGQIANTDGSLLNQLQNTLSLAYGRNSQANEPEESTTTEEASEEPPSESSESESSESSGSSEESNEGTTTPASNDEEASSTEHAREDTEERRLQQRKLQFLAKHLTAKNLKI